MPVQTQTENTRIKQAIQSPDGIYNAMKCLLHTMKAKTVLDVVTAIQYAIQCKKEIRVIHGVPCITKDWPIQHVISHDTCIPIFFQTKHIIQQTLRQLGPAMKQGVQSMLCMEYHALFDTIMLFGVIGTHARALQPPALGK